MDDQYGGSRQYYRFNVSLGLQDISLSDWDKASRISALTRNYIDTNNRAIGEFVNNFLYGPFAQSPISDAPSRKLSISTYFSVPFRENERFVGRGAILAKLEEMHFEKNCRQVALVGLGGIGKTQVAIQFAYWVKNNKPEYSVFWVPALNKSTFEQAYTDIARELPIEQGSEDVKVSVRRYLNSRRAGKWFLIFDNVDDMDVLYGSSGAEGGLKQYLPQSENGLTLFTTRSRKVAQACAESNMIELSQMDQQEGLAFLKTSLAVEYEETAASDLLRELAYLPLAIKQAVAYLNITTLSIHKYLELLQSTEQDLVGLMSEEFHDDFRYPNSQNAVATTWLVSFDQISKYDDAAHLLAFISRIEPKAIPQSILPEFKSKRRLLDAIGTLCSFAFLTRRGDGNSDDDIFDMHRLVHLGARIWIQRRSLATQVTYEAIIHLEDIFPGSDFAYQKLWQAYLPHALRVLHESHEHSFKERYWLFFLVGESLNVDMRMKESIWALEETYQWAINHLPEDDILRLNSGHGLAISYMNDDRTKEAIKLFEHVIAVKRKTLPEDDTELLASLHMVSIAYLRDGQIKEATTILERVVSCRRETLPENDNARLSSEHSLGQVYLQDGHVKDAIEVLEHIVAVWKMLPKEHPNRLASEHGLARVYLTDGRTEDAIKLLEHVVAVRKMLPKEHSSRPTSEHELARAYLKDGRVEDAIQLFEYVVAIQKMLPKEHRDRLTSEHELAMAYLQDGQVEDAIKLLEYVVAVRKMLPEEHRERLVSEHELARAYLQDGRVEKSIEILSGIVKIKTLKADDPLRISAERRLETAYGKLHEQQA